MCFTCQTPSKLKDPVRYGGTDGYKEAFLDGVQEYNSYGYAKMQSKHQVDQKEALELFGLKVSCQ